MELSKLQQDRGCLRTGSNRNCRSASNCVEIFAPLEKELWVYVRRAEETSLLLTDVEGRVVVKLSDYQTRPVRDHVPSAERSSKSELSSVFTEALRNIESMPETDFGLDPAKVDFECRGFELLEELGRLTLLKRLQNIGIFRTAGEEIDRESLRRVLGAVPKYYRLCDALVHFLKQGGFVEESGGSVRAAASLAEPATQRALAELGSEQERYYREFPNLTPHGTLLWSCIDALPQVISGHIAGDRCDVSERFGRTGLGHLSRNTAHRLL